MTKRGKMDFNNIEEIKKDGFKGFDSVKNFVKTVHVSHKIKVFILC